MYSILVTLLFPLRSRKLKVAAEARPNSSRVTKPFLLFIEEVKAKQVLLFCDAAIAIGIKHIKLRDRRNDGRVELSRGWCCLSRGWRCSRRQGQRNVGAARP